MIQRESDKNDEQLSAMVDRFLAWKLPEDFHPDAGISFTPHFNVEWNAKQGKPPESHNPIGTNLLTATQAKAMLEHVAGPALAAMQAEIDRLMLEYCPEDIAVSHEAPPNRMYPDCIAEPMAAASHVAAPDNAGDSDRWQDPRDLSGGETDMPRPFIAPPIPDRMQRLAESLQIRGGMPIVGAAKASETPLTDEHYKDADVGPDGKHGYIPRGVEHIQFCRDLEIRGNLLAATVKVLNEELAVPSSTRQTVDAVPVSEILSEIDHVQQNGIDVAKFGGQNVSEGRCRELCAMYLREFITSEGLRRKIVQMDAASLPATLTPDAKLEAAYAALRDACEYFTFEGQSTVGQRLFQYGKHAEVMKAVYGTSDGTAKP